MQSFKLKFSGVTILQGVEFPIFLLIFEWALQQCSATALPVIIKSYTEYKKLHSCYVIYNTVKFRLIFQLFADFNAFVFSVGYTGAIL